MYHHTVVAGYAGKDAEVKYTTSGQAVANFSIAVSEKFKDKEHTTWYRVQAWGKLAEFAGEYVKKKKPFLVEGRMNSREWEKDGVKRESWELIANSIKFLPSGNSGSSPSHDEPAHQSVVDEDSDIPF